MHLPGKEKYISVEGRGEFLQAVSDSQPCRNPGLPYLKGTGGEKKKEEKTMGGGQVRGITGGTLWQELPDFTIRMEPPATKPWRKRIMIPIISLLRRIQKRWEIIEK